ncbi:MAG: NADPH-dependent FMN reductase [Caulobacterales bacterium]
MGRKVALIVGSLRKESFNRKLALALQDMAPESLTLTLVEIGALPLYNEDLDNDTPPQAWTVFRQEVNACEGVLFVTPEYNRSVPGVLKNALDVGSRPYGKSVWAKKPAAIASSTPGGLGAFGANHHLRQSMVFLDVPLLQQPEIYLSQINKAFDEQGKLKDDGIRKLLSGFMSAFAAWVDKHASD